MSAAESKSREIDATAHLFLRLTQGGAEGFKYAADVRCVQPPKIQPSFVITL